MDFLIKWTLSCKTPLLRMYSDMEFSAAPRAVLFQAGLPQKSDFVEFSSGKDCIFLIGDMVLNPGELLNFETTYRLITSNTVHHRGGFFYLLHYSCEGVFCVYSSVFNILPLYYHQTKDAVYVSSRTDLIRKYSGSVFPVDKQYLLERLLFSYGMFNRTYWSGIDLVPGNHFIKLDSRIHLIQTFELTDLFVSAPRRGKHILNQVAESFIEKSSKYFPDERYALSFTGGFDGRTLLAVSQYLHKDFYAYSFGSSDSSDLYLPMEQAEKLGVNFQPIYLEDEYVEKYSLVNSLELIDRTECYSSFNRAHYLYAAKILGDEFNYMITGNFGSELFRAAHVVGVMFSNELYKLIASKSALDIAGIVKSSRKLKYLQLQEYTKEIDSLIAGLIEFRHDNAALTLNKLLYKFTLTEILRKYFGPEIVMQRNFINNRTPYLDFSFIKDLLNTYYCGSYGEFNTHNPVKRFKGQIAYAHIIRIASPMLFDLKTNKGYKPADLTGIQGKLTLILNLMQKRIKSKQHQVLDPHSVAKAFSHNCKHISDWPVNDSLYNSGLMRQLLADAITKEDREVLFSVLSSNYYLNKSLKG